jgi:soluble lytic murein transglycosylase
MTQKETRIRLVRAFTLLLTISAAASAGADCFGQILYSYIDENGVRNFTNIPPVNAVWDLQILKSSAPSPESGAGSTEDRSRIYDPIIEKYALEHGFEPSLIRSIIAAESGFNPKAVSRKGARGLMQLMPATAERHGVSNIFDPEENIRGGVKHLRWLMDNFNNNLDLSLAAYNAGENMVARLGRVPEIKETREYVRSVTQRYSKSQSEVQPRESAGYSPPYKFYDEEGVLHLTNIPSSR